MVVLELDENRAVEGKDEISEVYCQRYIATPTDAEIDEPDPFADIDEDENELEENEVVLEDC